MIFAELDYAQTYGAVHGELVAFLSSYSPLV
jgi:hypothetical protein